MSYKMNKRDALIRSNDQIILRGWSEIARVQGITAQAAKRRAERYKMPYVRLGGKVTISRMVLVEWYKGLCDIVGSGQGEGKFVTQLLKNLESKKKDVR